MRRQGELARLELTEHLRQLVDEAMRAERFLERHIGSASSPTSTASSHRTNDATAYAPPSDAYTPASAFTVWIESPASAS